jgi:hypothetical protein
MARKRTLVLMRTGEGGQMEPLGTLREVREMLGRCNIAPDGSGPHGYGERLGVALLFGPGLVCEIALPDDPGVAKGQGPPVAQVLVSLTDEDFGFPVLVRLCRQAKWKMLDPDSGRSFG